MKSEKLSVNDVSLDSAGPDASGRPLGDEAENLHESIAKLAYALWEQRGRPIGSPEQDWIEAQHEIGNPLAQAAGTGR